MDVLFSPESSNLDATLIFEIAWRAGNRQNSEFNNHGYKTGRCEEFEARLLGSDIDAQGLLHS